MVNMNFAQALIKGETKIPRAAHPRFSLTSYPPSSSSSPIDVFSSNRLNRIALIQLAVGEDKPSNIAAAVSEIHKAKENGAQFVVLPECFTCPYDFERFNEYAEPIETGETSIALSKAAIDAEVFVVGGTFPERCGDKLFNTCTVWDDNGDLIATYRKTHITGQESKVFSAGKGLTKFKYKMINVGIGIGSEIKEYYFRATAYKSAGCSLIVYPGAFDMSAGPGRWKQLCEAMVHNKSIMSVALVNRASDDKAVFGYTMMYGRPDGQFVHIDQNPNTLHCSICDVKHRTWTIYEANYDTLSDF